MIFFCPERLHDFLTGQVNYKKKSGEKNISCEKKSVEKKTVKKIPVVWSGLVWSGVRRLLHGKDL